MNENALPTSLGIEELAKVILVPRILIRPFPDQPRKFFDQQKLKELAESIEAVGQNVPGFVKEINGNGSAHRYELVDGQRRWHALGIAGVEKMKVIVLDVKDEDEQFLISVVSNFGRAEHGPLEIANAISRFKTRGKTAAEIAKIFAKSEAWVYQHLKIIEKLEPEVQQMMAQEKPEEDRLGFSMAIIIADVPKEKQKKIAETIVDGRLKMIQAKDLIRRKAEQDGYTVGNPERTPKSDYVILRNFFNKLRRELDVFTKMPVSFYSNMFQAREVEDVESMLRDIDRSTEDLRSLSEAIMKRKRK